MQFLWATIIKENDGSIVTLQQEDVVSQNVIFDATSSWWSPQTTTSPDSKEI